MLALTLGIAIRRRRWLALPGDRAPVLVTAPRLSGAGRIGTAIGVDPGVWDGDPVPTLAVQWLRDGAEIAGATNTSYTPEAADDLTDLSARIIATNSTGAATALSDDRTVTWIAPVASGAIPDVIFVQNSGIQTVNASSDFTGEGLSFRVAGEDVSISPETGVVHIGTDTLRDGVEVIVTAINSGGEATSRFNVTVALPTSEAVAPTLVTAPSLSGTGRIGAAVTLDTGAWDGYPVPDFTVQWLRDDAEITGATAISYTPGAEDDLTDLSARVTATNEAGAATAETGALAITQVAPAAADGLADVSFGQGSGPQAVETAGDFTGAALVFAVTGGGAVIDAATGTVTLPTDALRDGEIVTVTATNSGGSASSTFRVTVAAALLPPETVGTLPDVLYAQDSGVQTVSTQAGFSGAELTYALDVAPAGVTINAGSGLVTIPTDAALSGALITVRASNAAGAVTQDFRVTVGALVTSFDAAPALDEVTFLSESTAPSWTHDAAGFARLEPASASRTHGAWAKAGGDGLYRCLVRWSTSNWGKEGIQPLVFGARITKSGDDFAGVFISVGRPTLGPKYLECRDYTGSGTAVTVRESVRPPWKFNTWHWLEMDIVGSTVKARVYPEADPAPGWQLEATTEAAGAGAFGPGSFPFDGTSPVVDIKRLEYHPIAQPVDDVPPQPQGSDWTLNQTTEQ